MRETVELTTTMPFSTKRVEELNQTINLKLKANSWLKWGRSKIFPVFQFLHQPSPSHFAGTTLKLAMYGNRSLEKRLVLVLF